MKERISIFITLIFLLSFLIQPSQGSTMNTDVTWNEDFSANLDNWSMATYYTTPTTDTNSPVLSTSTEGGFSIQNDQLISEYASNNQYPEASNLSYISHDSKANYGNWSFDTYIADWSRVKQSFTVYFSFEMPNNNYDFSGYKILNLFNNTLALEFSNYILGNGKIIIRDNHGFPAQMIPKSSSFDSFHHFLITRYQDNQLNVTMDNQVILSAQTSSMIQSEKFVIANYLGFCNFDNISINGQEVPVSTSSSTNKNSNGFEFYTLIPVFIVLSIIIFRKRNLKE